MFCVCERERKNVLFADLNDNVADNQEIANSSLFNAHIGISYILTTLSFLFFRYISYI